MPDVVLAAQVINPTTTCEVTVHLETADHEPIEMQVRVGYYRSRLNKNFYAALESLMQLEDEDERKRQLDALFLRLVGRWNVLLEAGGKTIPLTSEALFPVDEVFLLEIVHGIGQHFRSFIPGESNGAKPNGALSASSGVKPHSLKRSSTASRRKN